MNFSRILVMFQVTAIWGATLLEYSQFAGPLIPLPMRALSGFVPSPVLLLAWGCMASLVFIGTHAMGYRIQSAFADLLRHVMKTRDESLTLHQEQLSELNLLTGEIAHELKNPLASIKGLAALLSRRSQGEEPEPLTVLRREVDRMQSILDEFLNYSRPLVPLNVTSADLGSITLQQLTPSALNVFYARLLSGSGAGSKRPLSPGTVRRIHATLHRALRDAVRWNKIARSPADGADPPRLGGTPEMKVWKTAELKSFLGAERETSFYPLWLLFATTGMRRGEALGLTWEDTDLESGRVAIRRTRVMLGYETEVSEPKTKKGRRLLMLDPATQAALQQHRERQEEQHRAAGLPLKETDWVFADADGLPYHPEFVSKRFRRASKKAGLPSIRLHDLRHTYATVALAAGIHPKIVSERLGHANIGITLDTYSHCLPAMSEEAACLVAALFVSG